MPKGFWQLAELAVAQSSLVEEDLPNAVAAPPEGAAACWPARPLGDVGQQDQIGCECGTDHLARHDVDVPFRSLVRQRLDERISRPDAPISR